MFKIKITDKFLTGNMGDGWRDNEEAANTFAGYVASRIDDELFGIADNYELNIGIHVENAAGDSGEMTVDVDGPDDIRAFNLKMEIENRLQSLDLWSEFCGNPDFEYLYEEGS